MKTPIRAKVFSQTNPIAAYGFNEGTGTTTADSSGSGKIGTLTNGPAWTAGKYGNGISFDGLDDVVILPSDNPRQQMTIMAWVNTNSRSGEAVRGHIFAIKDRTDQKPFITLRNTGTDGELRFEQGRLTGTNSVTIPYWNSQVNSVPNSQWVHVAVTYDGSSSSASDTQFYINGVPVSATLHGSLAGTFITDSFEWTIGNDLATKQTFDGVIDEVRVYDRILTESEIQNDMNTPL